MIAGGKGVFQAKCTGKITHPSSRVPSRYLPTRCPLEKVRRKIGNDTQTDCWKDRVHEYILRAIGPGLKSYPHSTTG